MGDFLRTLLAAGATRDWRRLIQETTGEELGPRALLEFFAPLNGSWRSNQGKARAVGGLPAGRGVSVLVRAVWC